MNHLYMWLSALRDAHGRCCASEIERGRGAGWGAERHAYWCERYGWLATAIALSSPAREVVEVVS